MSGPGPAPDGRGDPPDGSDREHPRLRPLEGDALAAALEQPDLLPLCHAGWRELIATLQGEPPRSALLMRALAWGLGLRDLLWWGCLSAKLEEIVSRRAAPSRALLAAERWLREGEDAVRYEAFRLARDTAKPTPGELAAYAVFTAGPSLGPPDGDPEPPPPGLARQAAESTLLAAAAAPALDADGFGFELVNMIGLDIARGGDGRAAARRALASASRHEAPPTGAAA